MEWILAGVFSLNLIFRPACVLLHYKRVLGFYYEFFREIFLFNNWYFFSHAEEVFSTRKGLYLLLFMQAYAFFRSRYTDAKWVNNLHVKNKTEFESFLMQSMPEGRNIRFKLKKKHWIYNKLCWVTFTYNIVCSLDR